MSRTRFEPSRRRHLAFLASRGFDPQEESSDDHPIQANPACSRGADRTRQHDARHRSERRCRRQDARQVRHWRLPQPHHLLRRFDLDAKAGAKGHGTVGSRLVRPGRARRQRQPQLHLDGRRIARYARLPDHATGPDHHLAEHRSTGAAEGPGLGCGAEPGHVALAVDPGIPIPADRVPERLQAKAALPRHRIGRRRARALVDVGDHRPDPGSTRQRNTADRAGLRRQRQPLHAARQRQCARAVGILFRPGRQRHQPRQHRSR